MTELNEDAIIACADLVDRAGASGLEIGHDEPSPLSAAQWYAQAYYQGARLMSGWHPSPSLAALALAERILSGGTCRCGQPVTLTDARPGCRWRLMGRRWEPGCDVPTVEVQGKRGDLDAMHAAIDARRRR